MFYFLSKTISILALPISWVLILLFYAWFAKRPLKKNIAIGLTVLLLYVTSISFITKRLLLWWEVPPIAFKDLKPHDVGIILSGPVNNFKSPKDRVYIGRGSDRFLHTADLYKKGLIKHILITGGHKIAGDKEVVNEAEKIKQVLLSTGVPDSAIVYEAEAKNTNENAINSARILSEKFSGKKYILVTSGYHMRRSVACFENRGVKVTPFSTDFLTHDLEDETSIIHFLPSSNNFSDFSLLVREMVGLMVYKLLGYA